MKEGETNAQTEGGGRGRDETRQKTKHSHPLDSTRPTDPDQPSPDWLVFRFTLFEKEAASSQRTFVIRAHKTRPTLLLLQRRSVLRWHLQRRESARLMQRGEGRCKQSARGGPSRSPAVTAPQSESVPTFGSNQPRSVPPPPPLPRLGWQSPQQHTRKGRSCSCAPRPDQREPNVSLLISAD